MRLDTLSNLLGVRACALVGEDGLPLEMQGELGDVLAAELAALRGSSERAGRRLGAGQMTRLAFTSDLIEVVAVFTGSFTLGAALLRGTDTRTAQQTLARIAIGLNDAGQMATGQTAAGLNPPGALPTPVPQDGVQQDNPLQKAAATERS